MTKSHPDVNDFIIRSSLVGRGVPIVSVHELAVDQASWQAICERIDRARSPGRRHRITY
jgi:hypothetical protein